MSVMNAPRSPAFLKRHELHSSQDLTSGSSSSCNSSFNSTMTINGFQKKNGQIVGRKILKVSTAGEAHQLLNNWTLWVWVGDIEKEWVECLKKQVTVKTVEQYLALKHCILPPSKLPPQTDYFFFKEGIKPMWEDSQNKNGGFMDLFVSHNYKQLKLDQYWEDLVMAVIGGAFGEANDHICGVVVCIRAKRADRIRVWIRDFKNHKLNTLVHEIFEEKLGLGSEESFRFKKHGTDH
jgi:translation initiation factor 4E